jgi:Rrf2 family protein
MKLSKKGEYALRAMVALANSQGKSMTITGIANVQNIPKKFLEQILLALKAAGLVVSRAGPKGGYELARGAKAISVGQILKAVEEPISRTPSSPLEALEEELPGAGAGRINLLLADIRHYVRQRLEEVALEEIAGENVPEDQVEALMWYI